MSAEDVIDLIKDVSELIKPKENKLEILTIVLEKLLAGTSLSYHEAVGVLEVTKFNLLIDNKKREDEV
jgi:hypothetical protein